jgi:hypothetical protein
VCSSVDVEFAIGIEGKEDVMSGRGLWQHDD